MAKLDFQNITPDNGAVKDLAELIFLKYYSEPHSLEKFCVFQTGVHTGDKFVSIGRFGPLGTRIESICNPTYGNSLINAQQKEWKLGRWAIYEKVCVDEITGTLVKHSLKSGTQVADMTGSDYIDAILLPLLDDAVLSVLWRLAWFGDEDATAITVADGAVTGSITPGLNVDLFTVCDGLFKRLIELSVSNPDQRITIAANTETTRALQKSKLRESGVATQLMDDTIDAMPMVLRQQENKAILITQSIADALDVDIRNNNKGSELHWESIFNGITVTTYRGYTVYAIALWDEMLLSFFRVKSGDLDYVINPHRIVATTLDNLHIGTSSTETVASLDSWYEKKDKVNYIDVTDTIGTVIKQDDLCVVGY